jgi:Tfp pilus assembly major pilin PilA
MHHYKFSAQGFTIAGLLITIGILGILAAIAIPFYQNYNRRADYSEIVQAANPYKLGVIECYQKTSDLTACDAGTNYVPAAITSPTGAVASLGVTDGVITVTPVAQNGIATGDTYILTPTVVNQTLTWAASGGGVTKGYAE